MSQEKPRSELIPLSKIRVLENPRKVYDKDKLEELIGSLRANGQIQDVVVRLADDGMFELIVGTRRLRAFETLRTRYPSEKRWEAISASIRDIEPALLPAFQLAENESRDNLNPIELADAIAEARRVSGKSDPEIAAQLGWSSKRPVQMYAQLSEAPTFIRDWSASFAYPTQKVDKEGTPILGENNRPVIHYEKAERFSAYALQEFVKFHRKLEKWDAKQKALNEIHRPRAEAETQRLAESFAREQWSIAALREKAEARAKKIVEPRSKGEGRADPAQPPSGLPSVFTFGEKKLIIDRSQLKAPLPREELLRVKAQLADILVELGFTSVLMDVPKELPSDAE